MLRAIDPATFANLVIFPALTAIGLYSPAAEELVLGTALQESGLLYLHQVNGPALGFFQMEPATHDDIWKNYVYAQPDLERALRAMTIDSSALSLAEQMIGNAFYAAAMCRVFYRRLPEALPAQGDLAGQAAFYKLHYNTPAGAATEAEYIANWRAAFPAGATLNTGASA